MDLSNMQEAIPRLTKRFGSSQTTLKPTIGVVAKGKLGQHKARRFQGCRLDQR